MRRLKIVLLGIVSAACGVLFWHEFIFPEIHANLCDSPTTYRRPKGMDIPGYINPAKNRQVVVFVHGIRDDGTHTWTNSNGQYWPSLLASEAKGWDVYVAQYPDSISVDEIGSFLKTDLGPVFEAHDRVYVVAHSMGGLAAREFLIKNRAYGTKVAGMFFLATPSLGSPIANLVSRLGIGNKQSADLRTLAVNPFLKRQLQEWTRLTFQMQTKCAYEIRRTWLFEVVSRDSSQALCSDEARPLDASHSSIAKPECSSSYQQRMLMSFLAELPPLAPDEIVSTYNFPGSPEVARRDNVIIFNLTPAEGGLEFANKTIRLNSLIMTAKIASESDEAFGFDVELIPASDDLDVAVDSADLGDMQVAQRYSNRHSLIHFQTRTDTGRAVHSPNPLVMAVPMYRRSSDALSVVSVKDSDIKVGQDGLKLQLFLWTLWGGQHSVKFDNVTITIRAEVVR